MFVSFVWKAVTEKGEREGRGRERHAFRLLAHSPSGLKDQCLVMPKPGAWNLIHMWETGAQGLWFAVSTGVLAGIPINNGAARTWTVFRQEAGATVSSISIAPVVISLKSHVSYSLLAYIFCVSRELDWNWIAETWTGAHIGCWLWRWKLNMLCHNAGRDALRIMGRISFEDK